MYLLLGGHTVARSVPRSAQDQLSVQRSLFVIAPVWLNLSLPLCRLCPSYPQQLLVPVWITDKELENVAAFRSWKRIPAVVYRWVGGSVRWLYLSSAVEGMKPPVDGAMVPLWLLTETKESRLLASVSSC